jgi:hypothetical protein
MVRYEDSSEMWKAEDLCVSIILALFFLFDLARIVNYCKGNVIG